MTVSQITYSTIGQTKAQYSVLREEERNLQEIRKMKMKLILE